MGLLPDYAFPIIAAFVSVPLIAYSPSPFVMPSPSFSFLRVKASEDSLL